MSDPISMNDAAYYENVRQVPNGPLCLGVFIQNGTPLPVQFWAEDIGSLRRKMEAWLLAEREKLARREEQLAYLRSDEAIAARKAASEARKLAKATREAA